MAKSLLELNREYDYKCFVEEREAAKTSPKESTVKNMLFYGLLIVAVVVAFFYRSGDNSGQSFGPFAYNTVLTKSMTAVYPKGSLVTSWAVKPGEPLQAGLDKGTDIVFIRDDGMVIVHRIIEIMDNYEESGQRGFRTQGVSNPTPDDWVTYEGNVIGRVTGHVEYLGDLLAFIAEKIVWVVVVVIAIFALLAMLKVAFKKEPPEETEDSEDDPEQQDALLLREEPLLRHRKKEHCHETIAPCAQNRKALSGGGRGRSDCSSDDGRYLCVEGFYTGKNQ